MIMEYRRFYDVLLWRQKDSFLNTVIVGGRESFVYCGTYSCLLITGINKIN